MVKKIRKTKEKVKITEIEKKIIRSKYLLISLAIFIVIIALIVNFSFMPQIQLGGGSETRPQVISEITQTTSTCTRDSECFVVGCKSNNVLECVNTDQMENYYKTCKGWWDVDVEVQNPSKCTCIQNNCKTP